MKINKKILAMLIVGGMLFSTGCDKVNNVNNNNVNPKTGANVNDFTETENTTIKSKYSKEELKSKYKELLPEIKQAFTDYGIKYYDQDKILPEVKQYLDYEGESDLKSKFNWNESNGIYFNDWDSKNSIVNASFTIYHDFKDEGSIYFNSIMNIKSDDTEDTNFDIRGTFFETITEIINSKNNSVEIDFEQMNQDINSILKEGIYLTKKYNYGNLKISIDVTPLTIFYSIEIL